MNKKGVIFLKRDVKIASKYLQINKISALNIPEWVDMPLNK